MVDAINIECMLLSWAETSNGGAKIVLQLADPGDLERFKLMTIAKGRGKTAVAGQRLACAFVEIGDDEQPVQREKGGPLSQLAGRWCNDERFQQWLQVTHTFAEIIGGLEATDELPSDQVERAAEIVRVTCGVESRATLDHNPEAAERFHKLIREPYQRYLQGLQA